jgi:uncharacterized membrane-anchored protein YjiN (DUF445 family)
MTDRTRTGSALAPLTPPIPQPVTASPEDDAERERRLALMKRRATGLLVVCTGVLVVAALLETRWPWLGYLRAAAEAAVIGGLADWFAVTALFRHPMGLKIPHTAIIPMRKDRIGKSLGRFVQNNFLAPELIAQRVAATRPGERVARWLAEREHAHKVAGHVSSGLAAAADVLGDDEVSASIERGLVSGARSLKVAPLLGRLLGVVRADGRYREFVDEAFRLALRAAARNEEIIRERIRDESPWWVPEAVDEKIHERIVGAIERTLARAASDPDHTIRRRFDAALDGFIERLESSPDTMARAEAIKEHVLAHPVMREFATRVWTDVKSALNRGAHSADPEAVERAIVRLAEAVLADEALLAKLDQAIVSAVAHAVDPYRHEVAQFIEHTVSQWDPDATSRRIELSVGRDLQFIRINGTLVGGLVGLILYTLHQLL